MPESSAPARGERPRLILPACSVHLVRRSYHVGEVQYHRLTRSETEVPSDESTERERLARAFEELRLLDAEVSDRAAAIFARHGLPPDFGAGVVFFCGPPDPVPREGER
jgi:hypothetical protein